MLRKQISCSLMSFYLNVTCGDASTLAFQLSFIKGAFSRFELFSSAAQHCRVSNFRWSDTQTRILGKIFFLLLPVADNK